MTVDLLKRYLKGLKLTRVYLLTYIYIYIYILNASEQTSDGEGCVSLNKVNYCNEE